MEKTKANDPSDMAILDFEAMAETTDPNIAIKYLTQNGWDVTVPSFILKVIESGGAICFREGGKSTYECSCKATTSTSNNGPSKSASASELYFARSIT